MSLFTIAQASDLKYKILGNCISVVLAAAVAYLFLRLCKAGTQGWPSSGVCGHAFYNRLVSKGVDQRGIDMKKMSPMLSAT